MCHARYSCVIHPCTGTRTDPCTGIQPCTGTRTCAVLCITLCVVPLMYCTARHMVHGTARGCTALHMVQQLRLAATNSHKGVHAPSLPPSLRRGANQTPSSTARLASQVRLTLRRRCGGQGKPCPCALQLRAPASFVAPYAVPHTQLSQAQHSMHGLGLGAHDSIAHRPMDCGGKAG